MTSTTHSVLLFHGSRVPATTAEGRELAAGLHEQTDVPVTTAFLQHGEPLLESHLEQVVAGGARSITVFPLFALTGQHVAHDIPGVIDGFRQRHPDVTVALQPHLAQDPSFREWLAGRVLGTSRRAGR